MRGFYESERETGRFLSLVCEGINTRAGKRFLTRQRWCSTPAHFPGPRGGSCTARPRTPQPPARLGYGRTKPFQADYQSHRFLHLYALKLQKWWWPNSALPAATSKVIFYGAPPNQIQRLCLYTLVKRDGRDRCDQMVGVNFIQELCLICGLIQLVLKYSLVAIVFCLKPNYQSCYLKFPYKLASTGRQLKIYLNSTCGSFTSSSHVTNQIDSMYIIQPHILKLHRN